MIIVSFLYKFRGLLKKLMYASFVHLVSEITPNKRSDDEEDDDVGSDNDFENDNEQE